MEPRSEYILWNNPFFVYLFNKADLVIFAEKKVEAREIFFHDNYSSEKLQQTGWLISVLIIQLES